MTLHTGLLDRCQGVPLRDSGVTFDTFHRLRHHIGLGLLLAKALSLNELHLRFMAIDTLRLRLVMTTQTLHPRLEDLSMFLPRSVADVTVQNSCDMFLVGKRMAVNLNLCIFKSLVTFAALRMGNLDRLWQRNGSSGMTG